MDLKNKKVHPILRNYNELLLKEANLYSPLFCHLNHYFYTPKKFIDNKLIYSYVYIKITTIPTNSKEYKFVNKIFLESWSRDVFHIFIYWTPSFRRKTHLHGQQEQDSSSITILIRFLDCLFYVCLYVCMYTGVYSEFFNFSKPQIRIR